MPLGRVLNEAGEIHAATFFPIDCMISLVASTDSRSTLEVGLIGREGMTGVGLALGIPKSPVLAIVQGKGTAIRIPSAEFAKTIGRNSALRAQAHRYAYVSMAVAMQLAACNNEHGLESRLARWLLMARDCLSTETFAITQEFLGQMLGVHRPSVNVVATELQRRGLIGYRRGVMKLRDLPGLKAASCSCYTKIRRLIDLVPDPL